MACPCSALAMEIGIDTVLLAAGPKPRNSAPHSRGIESNGGLRCGVEDGRTFMAGVEPQETHARLCAGTR